MASGSCPHATMEPSAYGDARDRKRVDAAHAAPGPWSRREISSRAAIASSPKWIPIERAFYLETCRWIKGRSTTSNNSQTCFPGEVDLGIRTSACRSQSSSPEQVCSADCEARYRETLSRPLTMRGHRRGRNSKPNRPGMSINGLPRSFYETVATEDRTR